MSLNYVIGTGAALAIYGIRDSFDDIDVSVTPETYARLIKLGHVSHYDESFKVNIITFKELNIDVHSDAEQVKQPTEFIHGMRVSSPEVILEMKRRMRNHPDRKREKIARDDKDIAALEQLIRSRK